MNDMGVGPLYRGADRDSETLGPWDMTQKFLSASGPVNRNVQCQETAS